MGFLGRFLILVLILKTPEMATAKVPMAPPLADFFNTFTDHSLFDKPDTISRDQWLELLKSQFPELKIVVLALPAPQFPNVPPLEFKDNSVDSTSQEYYHQYSLTMIQNVAFYAAPGAGINDDFDRPEINSPLLVLRENTPFHALMHETGHFLIDHEQRKAISDNSFPNITNPSLLRILASVGEESFVDALLLSQAEAFSWKLTQICPRHKYLSQNNQVLKFHLDELQKTETDLSVEDRALVDEIADLYRWTRRLQSQWHTDCFLWAFKN